MGVFKPSGRRKFEGKLKDWEGRWRKVALLQDRRASERRLSDMQADADRVAARLMTPEEWAKKWIERPDTDASVDPVAMFVEALRAGLKPGRGGSPAHVRRTEARVRAVLAVTPVLTPESVNAFLATLAEAGSGVQTRNHYLRACKMFTRWKRRVGLALSDPLLDVSLGNVATDRKRERRALTPDQFAQLITSVATSGRVRFGLDPARRRLLYLLASVTGLRAQELASLTPESFHFANDRASVVVRASISKGRKTAAIPVASWLTEELRAFLATLSPGEPVFAARWSRENRGAKMLRADLEAAGLPYTDAAGKVFDFHSLRVQTASNLARAEVPLATAQKIMRHSTPILTANVYTDLGFTDLADAVDRVPAVAEGGNATKGATKKRSRLDATRPDASSSGSSETSKE